MPDKATGLFFRRRRIAGQVAGEGGETLIRKIAEKIIRYRVQVLLVIVALTVFFAWHLKDIKIAFGGGDIVPPNHPYVKLTERMVEKYGGEHLVEIAIQVKKGDVLDPVNLAKVYRIDQKLREMQGVVTSKIISVASRKFSRVNFAYDELGYSTLHFEKYQDLVRKINDGDSKEATAFREEVLNNDMISGTIVSPDRKRTLILAGFRYEEDYRYIFETLQKIVNEEKDANTEFFLAGRPIMLGYIDSAFRGILVVFAIAVLVMVVTLYLDFRTIRGVLLPLSSGLIGVVWGLGFMSLLGHRIDVLGVTIPFLLVALAHGHSVQILSRYYYEYANGRNRGSGSRVDDRPLETNDHLYFCRCSGAVRPDTDAFPKYPVHGTGGDCRHRGYLRRLLCLDTGLPCTTPPHETIFSQS
ncbi:MMPL family transporter [Geotalea toluenoxydans]|uniref:MMPL family transporter n=1 Tax=Geotalea toluenoxydans TaxID=421624 RepID=UPI0006D2631A|nr:MMPL family transporter [Geotalea toluenoxydans]